MARKVTNCEHTNKVHLARGLCRNCYNKLISKENPRKNDNCPHKDRDHHARGKCRECAKEDNGRKAECHPNKPHHANGQCFKCYRKEAMKNNERRAVCHPDRPYLANDLCKYCYNQTLGPNSVKATCHPDREHDAKGYCRECSSKHQAVKAKYGLTLDQYLQLWNDQNRKCKICKRTLLSGVEDGFKQLTTLERHYVACVDHDHETGKIRGVLCPDCNTGIARLQENVEVLKEAINYLMADSPIPSVKARVSMSRLIQDSSEYIDSNSLGGV